MANAYFASLLKLYTRILAGTYTILDITYLSILARLNVGQSVSAAKFKIFWASESSMGSMLVSQLFSLSMDPTMTHFLLKNAFSSYNMHGCSTIFQKCFLCAVQPFWYLLGYNVGIAYGHHGFDPRSLDPQDMTTDGSDVVVFDQVLGSDSSAIYHHVKVI